MTRIRPYDRAAVFTRIVLGLFALAAGLAPVDAVPAEVPADPDVLGPGPFLQEAQIRPGVLATAEAFWSVSDQRFGMRVQRHPEMLPPGTVLRPAVPGAGAGAALVCENACWFHFIDRSPDAHFAHPVVYVVTDAVTGVQSTIEANWWPELAGPRLDSKMAFSKLDQRFDPSLNILERPSLHESVPADDVAPGSGSSDPPPAGTAGILSALGDPCTAWAILVCGYDDLPDTFDDDTNGMYAVLRDLGMPADRIYYLSPHTSHEGVDRTTTRDNVDWAVQQVAAQADAGDKVLFLYSSHGDIDALSCIGGGISATRLDDWLDSIPAEETTVIIEACHSGSLIGRYADGTYVAAEDDLTGEGETNRAVFTSASTDTSSYADVDGADDPNPGDVGSETVWGYIEAFDTPAADTDSNGAISFLEGWQYSWDNDVTRIRGWNVPQMTHTGLDGNRVYPHCFPTAATGGPYANECLAGGAEIALDGSATVGPDPCGPYTYSWSTDCPGGSFDDAASAAPILIVDTGGVCVGCEVDLTVTCDEGSFETRSTSVTIFDDTAPSLDCPADVVVACDEPTDPDHTGQASAIDACDPDPAIDRDDATTPGACPQEYTVDRTWTTQDACGNTAACGQTVTVVDEDAPATSCNAPATIVPPDAPVTFTATAVDACDGDPAVEITGYRCLFYAPSGKVVDKGDSCIVAIEGDSIHILDSGGVGDHIFWSVVATDACGNAATTECHVEVERP